MICYLISGRAQQIYNAKSIDEIIRLANQVSRLSEFLKKMPTKGETMDPIMKLVRMMDWQDAHRPF